MCKEQTIYITLLQQLCANGYGFISPVLCFFMGRKMFWLRLFEKRMTRRAIGPERDWRKMHTEELLYTILFSSSIQGILGWARRVATRFQCLSALPGYPSSLPSRTDIFLLPTASRPVRITQTPPYSMAASQAPFPEARSWPLTSIPLQTLRMRGVVTPLTQNVLMA
jgi:hypothetical protein